MIDEGRYLQFGFKRTLDDIKGITIHNTSNYTDNAQDIFDWLNTKCTTSQGCHYLVDDSQTIEVMPHDWAVFHTGKAYDYGNTNTIAIEICSNLNDEKYLEAQTRAIKLIKKLMKKYNLTTNEIYFHQDFNQNTCCPADILRIYGNKKNFIDEFF